MRTAKEIIWLNEFASFSIGHKHSKTTEIYTHVSVKSIGKIRSPLDSLILDEGGAK
jgi:hypothetical protein